MRIVRVIALAAALTGGGGAFGEGGGVRGTSVAAANGVVVHGVDTEQGVARLRSADDRLARGDAAGAAKDLADLASADLSRLVLDSEGAYLRMAECVSQRVAALPPEGLAVYRRLLDARADAALDAAAKSGDTTVLARECVRLPHASAGFRMHVLLADLRLARGDLDGAARALEDALRLRSAAEDAALRPDAMRRLAAIRASLGDGPGVRAILADGATAGPAGASEPPLDPDLAAELGAAAAAADRRSPLAVGPDGPLAVEGEFAFRFEVGARGVVRTGAVYEFPLPVGTAADPRLFARVTRDGLPPRIAVIGMRDGSLDTLWAWPSSVGDRPLGTLLRPFAPAAVETQRGTFVAFPWPAIGSGRNPRFDELVDDDDARNELVLLGLSGEGRVADVRGRDEKERDDGDAEFETLSFCGRPAVSGGAVYVTAVRFAEKSEATELHVARFDVAGSADAPRLRLRWRRHVLDGTAMPSARFPANEARGVATAGSNEESGPAVAFPSSPTVLAGRVFVCSNTGAVACLDAASGEPEWIETYERFGPSSRITIRQAVPRTWEDVALHADGAFVYAAPLDSEHMIQFRRAPRRARSVRVETFPLAAAGGTATRAGALPSDLAPDQIASIRDGVAVLSGRVTRRALGALPTPASPLVFFDVAARRLATAQVQESAASGIPTPVRGGVLFPTPKAIYRVPLGSTEAAPQVLWRNDAKETEPRRMLALLDRVGNLVPDGAHVWSVTPSRIVLLRAAAK